MADALLDFLAALKNNQETVKRRAAEPAPSGQYAQTVVEYRTDPKYPFTQVTIFAPTEQEAQTAIARAMRSVERDGGMATFKGPRRVIGGFGAVGEIIDVPQEDK